MSETGQKVAVRVYPFREGLAYGNIIWPGKYPMRAGKFPPTHPCAPKSEGYRVGSNGQGGEGPALDAFRALGYWASCFPEGDGITWKPERGQTDAQCLQDIREAFGWTAEWAEGATP